MAQGPLGRARILEGEKGLLPWGNRTTCIFYLISMRHRGGDKGGGRWRRIIRSSDLYLIILCAYAWPAHRPSGKPLAPSKAARL